jgi:RNA polymerase sigma-70 factor (ECF subfamily)
MAPRDREVFSLKYGARFTNRSIASFTGLSETNVGTILHRLVMTLRNDLKEEA